MIKIIEIKYKYYEKHINIKILLLFRIIEFNLNIQFFNFIKLKFKKRCLGN